MGRRLPRVGCIQVALGALLLLLLAGVAVPCKNVSGVDLCDDFLNSTGCDCDIVDVDACLVHMTCDANSTYSGSVPNFSKLEEQNFSLFLTIQYRQLHTFDVSFLGDHPQLQTVELRDNGLYELVGSLPPRHTMQKLAIIDNDLSSIGDHTLEGLKVTQLDLTNNSFTAVPSVALGSMVQVDHLLLSHNPLGDLAPRAFNRTDLKSLDVSYCDIATIAPTAFIGMKDLSTLALNNNQLTRIETHYFTVLSREQSPPNHNSLTTLSLQFNRITDIEPGSFNYSQLQTLDVYRNRLRVLQAGVLTVTQSLRRLDLSYNELEEMEEGALDGVHVLQGEVDLSYNHLTQIEAHYFRDLDFQSEDNPHSILDLSHNKIEYIAPQAFTKFSELYRVRLNFNQLPHVVGVFEPTKELVVVEMEENLLTHIPNASLPMLSKWDLEHNRIRHVGADDLTPFPKLKSLHLSNNTELESFHEDSLSGVPELELLHCKHCRLTRFPNFKPSTKLMDIDLSYNQITDFPEDICVGKKSLSEINVASNLLTQFPNVTRCTYLDALVVARNRIKEIPDDALSGLEHLRILSIDYNEISVLPPDLIKGKLCFRELTAGHNRISVIPEGFFSDAFEMEDLNLEYNQLTRLERDVFTNLTYLHKLLLSHNQIAYIDDWAWQNGSLHFLTDLDLSYNPLTKLPAPGEGYPHLQRLILTECPNLWVVPPPNATKRIERIHYTYSYHCCLWTKQLPSDWREPERLDYDDVYRYRATAPSHTVPTTSAPTQPTTTLPPSFTTEPFPNFPDTDFGGDNVLDLIKEIIDSFGGILLDPGNVTTDEEGNRHIVDVKCKERVHPASNLDDLRCFPRYHVFTPCEDLLGSWALRVLVWAVVILALSGNAAVLFVMVASKKTMDTPQFLISNLAFADLLLGVYLTFISVVDLQTHGSRSFYLTAVAWQMGAGCKTAGFLAIFSTELSVYLLVVITFERLYTFTYAMQNKRLEMRPAIVLVVIGWAAAFTFAILPILPIGINSYSAVAVCLPFEVESVLDKLYIGSLVVINLIGLVIVVAFYMRIYCVLRRSSAANSNSADRKLIRSILLLTVVDFLCWAPLSVVTLAAIFDIELINTSVAKWFVVLIFPINACCNPFLYAIFTKKFRQRVQQTLCCGTKQSALQRQLHQGQSTQRLSARRTSISIAELHRRASSGSLDYSTPFRSRLNSTQPLLHLLSSGGPSSAPSNSDRTSITSLGSTSAPSGMFGRRSSLPTNLTGSHPAEQSREGHSLSGFASPEKGITPELYQRLLPSLRMHSFTGSGSWPNLPDGCNHEAASPSGLQVDSSPSSSFLLPALQHRTLSPIDHHVTNLSTVPEASNENLQSQPSASLEDNPLQSSPDGTEPLTFEEMKPLSKSVFEALLVSQRCNDDAIPLGAKAEVESQLSPPQPEGGKARTEQTEREGCMPSHTSSDTPCESSLGDTARGVYRMKELEELCESPWTPVRKPSAVNGWSGEEALKEGLHTRKTAGQKYTIVAFNPRFQSEVIGSETEV